MRSLVLQRIARVGVSLALAQEFGDIVLVRATICEDCDAQSLYLAIAVAGAGARKKTLPS